MNLEDCYWAGYLTKPHGIKGELKAVFDVTNISEYEEKASVYLHKEGPLRQFLFEYVHILNDREAIVAFKGINSRNEADALKGLQMYFPLTDLPKLSGDQFYYHEITGFQVVDQKLGELGKIISVEEMPAHDLIVMFYKGKEVLIPITNQFVLSPDREKKTLATDLPDGLLEAYFD